MSKENIIDQKEFENRVPCTHCAKMLSNNPSGIKRHEKTCPKNPDKDTQEKYTCQKCGNGFGQKKELTRHQKTSKKCINL